LSENELALGTQKSENYIHKCLPHAVRLILIETRAPATSGVSHSARESEN
jgi:hypothetical protein